MPEIFIVPVDVSAAGVCAKPLISIGLLFVRLRTISPLLSAAVMPDPELLTAVSRALRSLVKTSAETVAQVPSTFRKSTLTFPLEVRPDNVIEARSAVTRAVTAWTPLSLKWTTLPAATSADVGVPMTVPRLKTPPVETMG